MFYGTWLVSDRNSGIYAEVTYWNCYHFYLVCVLMMKFLWNFPLLSLLSFFQSFYDCVHYCNANQLSPFSDTQHSPGNRYVSSDRSASEHENKKIFIHLRLGSSNVIDGFRQTTSSCPLWRDAFVCQVSRHCIPLPFYRPVSNWCTQ